MRLRSLPAVLTLIWLGCQAAPPHRSTAVLVIRGGTVLNGSGRIIENATLIVRDGRIEEVGAAGSVHVPAEAAILEAKGGWIVPGFIDNHVHASGMGAVDEWTRQGVTTLVDNGSSIPPDQLRGRGFIPCGRILTARGGYPALGDANAPAFEMADAAGVEAAIDARRPDCVKVAVERGFLADYGDEGWPALTPEQIRAVVELAHQRRLLVRAHVTQSGELRAAMESGVDVLAHTPIDSIPDELLRECARRGIIFVSTAALWRDPEVIQVVTDNLSRYTKIGGRIAIGTDAPNLPGNGVLEELQTLAGGGIPPSVLLRGLTIDGAAAVGRTDLGALEPGSRADIVILSSDPRKSIEAFSTIRAVVRGGRIIKR